MFWVSPYTQRRKWQPIPVFLPGKSHEWRSLVGCSPWGFKESDTAEHIAHGMARNGDGSIWIISMDNSNPLWVLAQDEFGCQFMDVEQARTCPPRN